MPRRTRTAIARELVGQEGGEVLVRQAAEREGAGISEAFRGELAERVVEEGCDST